jgi:hypothetical protein
VDQHIKEVEIGEDWRARRTEEERARMLKENAPVIEAIAKEVNKGLPGACCLLNYQNVDLTAVNAGGLRCNKAGK